MLNKILPLFFLFILIGCGTPVCEPTEVIRYVEKEVPLEIEVVKYVDKPCETTQPNYTQQNCTTIIEIPDTNSSYILGLIRQIKRLENQQVKYWNLTECGESLDECNRILNRIKNVTGG